MLRVVVERIAHGERLRNSGRPNLDAILACDLRCGPMPLVICARDGELIQLVAIADAQALTHVSECEHDLRAGDLRAAKHGAGLGQLAPIDICERPEGHAMAYVE